MECPVGADMSARLLQVVHVHVAVEKPGLDEPNHLTIAIDSTKFGYWVFEVHVCGIDFISLSMREAIVIGLERGEDVHEPSSRG